MQTIECCPTYVQKVFDMNHPTDRDPETSRGEDSKHLKLLDTLVNKIIRTLNNNECSAIIWDDQLLLWWAYEPLVLSFEAYSEYRFERT